MAMQLLCSDYLDLKPSNIVTDEDVYANESGVKTALTRLYIDLPMKIIVLINVGASTILIISLKNWRQLLVLQCNRKQDDES